jgi:hypothetical protein
MIAVLKLFIAWADETLRTGGALACGFNRKSGVEPPHSKDCLLRCDDGVEHQESRMSSSLMRR